MGAKSSAELGPRYPYRALQGLDVPQRHDISLNSDNSASTICDPVLEDMLREQAGEHYHAYASQQHPNDENEQRVLVAKLLNQLFTNYRNETLKSISQHEQEQTVQLDQLSPQSKDENCAKWLGDDPNNYKVIQNKRNGVTPLGRVFLPLLWKRKGITDFKASVNDAILSIQNGESYTIKVPTHPKGVAIYWEFATDKHDLGFSLAFEWTICPGQEIHVDLSDWSDEEADEYEGLEDRGILDVCGDVEKGKPDTVKTREVGSVEPCSPHDDLVPYFRRNSHLHTICGYHRYQGIGHYLFKFDNSYSLWRSKMLYFKVHYCE